MLGRAGASAPMHAGGLLKEAGPRGVGRGHRRPDSARDSFDRDVRRGLIAISRPVVGAADGVIAGSRRPGTGDGSTIIPSLPE
jgi:hypothetical protein